MKNGLSLLEMLDFLNEFTGESESKAIISHERDLNNNNDVMSEEKYETWMDVNQGPRLLDEEELLPQDEEELHPQDEPINEDTGEVGVEQRQPQIEMKRGPGRPRKVFTGQRGRPRLMYNYIPNTVQPNSDEIEADNVGEHMDSSDEDDMFYDANFWSVQANVSEVDPKHALEGSDS